MRSLTALAAILLVTTAPIAAQSPATDYRDEFLRHFAQSSQKVVSLSEAIPADKYAWSPGPGVMTIAHVYAHIAHYNFLYLTENLGMHAPHGVDWENLETLTDKDQIREALQHSVRHVRMMVEGMSEEDLTAQTELYGRQVPGWAVLFQLLAHMNEHVGQSVSYARMNGITPPWSR